MITVKVNFSGGDHLTTCINATEQEARQYYEGNVFNVGLGPHDNLKRCTGIEVLKGEQEQ